MRRLDPRFSITPGARIVVRLDVAEDSLPVLIEGVDVERVWLDPQGDDLYALCAQGRLGEARKQPGIPAVDLLTDLVNELGDELDADDVPQHVRDKWDELVEQYERRTRPPPPQAEET